MAQNLYEMTDEYRYLLDLMEDPDVDPQTIQDTLEGLDGMIEEKADGYAMVRLELKAQSEKLDKEIKRLQARKKTVENNEKNLVRSLLFCMKAMEKKKIKTDRFSFTVKKGPDSLVIDDEDAVPAEFKEKQPDKILSAELKRSLKDLQDKDEFVPYAHLKSEDVLQIR